MSCIFTELKLLLAELEFGNYSKEVLDRIKELVEQMKIKE